MNYGGGAPYNQGQGPYNQQAPPYPNQPPYPQQGYPAYPPQQGYPPPQPGFQPPPPQPGFQQPPIYNQDMYGGTDYKDPESGAAFEFSDKSIRRGFIRKVYAILMCQLAVSVGVIAWFVNDPKTYKYVNGNPVIIILAFVALIITTIVLSCCENVRRQAPTNFIVLGIFTGVESLFLGCIAGRYDPDIVFLAVVITAVVCLGLTLFAFQTKYDFTMIGGFLFVALLVLMLFGILSIFMHGKLIKLVYASVGALIFSVYLIYDTQLMIGGQHKYSITPEEYIFAALNLYMDIVNIFIYILTIIGNSKD